MREQARAKGRWKAQGEGGEDGRGDLGENVRRSFLEQSCSVTGLQKHPLRRLGKTQTPGPTPVSNSAGLGWAENLRPLSSSQARPMLLVSAPCLENGWPGAWGYGRGCWGKGKGTWALMGHWGLKRPMEVKLEDAGGLDPQASERDRIMQWWRELVSNADLWAHPQIFLTVRVFWGAGELKNHSEL